MREQDTISAIKHLVCIRSLIYNHKDFVVQSLDGMHMQQTTFPFLMLLEDDASTDGTTDVIGRYLAENFNLSEKQVFDYEGAETTFAQSKKNEHCYVAYIRLKYNHFGKFKRDPYNSVWRDAAKYEALCEGDDYWTDPLKIQKQVDFLEAHPDCALCYTKANIWSEKDNGLTSNTQGEETTFEKLLLGYNTVPSASTVFRRSMLREYNAKIEPPKRKWRIGDYPQVLFFAKEAQLGYLDEATCVYRVLGNSASHSRDERSLIPYYYSILDIKLFFYTHYRMTSKVILDAIVRQHMGLIYSRVQSKRECMRLGSIVTTLPLAIRMRCIWLYFKFLVRRK